MTSLMARNVSGETTSIFYACAYHLTPSYTNNGQSIPLLMEAVVAFTIYLLFRKFLVKGLPVVVSLVEVDRLSTLFGRSLLPAHVLLLKSQWL